MEKPHKRLAGIMPNSPGKHTVAGVKLVYVHTEIISGQHVDVATFKHLTADAVKDWLPRSLNRDAIANGFSIALHSALFPVSELVRVAELVKKGMD